MRVPVAIPSGDSQQAEYMIIPGGSKGPMAGSGATVKLHYTWYRHDTVWQSSRTNPTKSFFKKSPPAN